MKIMPIRFLALFLLAASLGGAALAQSKDGRSVHEVATYQGPDRLARLIEGAKKEGEISIYYAHPVVLTVLEAFSQKYGVKVKTWRAGSEAMQQRFMAEARAGKQDVDMVLNTAMDTEANAREKMLQEVWSPHQADLVEHAVPKHRQWTAFNLDVFVANYNTKLVKKEELPKTYQDLLDPKWKGRLAVEANDHVWYAALLADMGEERGRKLFENIIAVNGMSVRKGHSLLAGLVASGEVPLALTVYNWNSDALKRKGAPIDMHLIGPLYAFAAAMGVPNKAPHPNAAVLFYDFMLTEGQKILAEAAHVPTSKKVESPLTNMPVRIIDAMQALESQDKWVKMYDEAFIKKAR